MFGLSWGQIAIILLVGVFVLGPERIPTAVSWVMSTLRKLRTMAAGAQAELRREIGPELDELRRQVAELQSLKELQDLRELRELHPKRLIGKSILGDQFSGGIGGFLGMSDQGMSDQGTSDQGKSDQPKAQFAAPMTGPPPATTQPAPVNDRHPASGAQSPDGVQPAGALQTAAAPRPPSAPIPRMPEPTPHVAPAVAAVRLAPPKVVGTFTRPARPDPPSPGTPSPFDPDGT